jgi:hypothetical protein
MKIGYSEVSTEKDRLNICHAFFYVSITDEFNNHRLMIQQDDLSKVFGSEDELLSEKNERTSRGHHKSIPINILVK